MSDSDFDVSVVVTTYNRKPSLDRCLKSLAEQTFSASRYEVIVVDDGSTDGTEEFLRTYAASHKLQKLRQKNEGQPAAQNAGVKLASGEIVIFIDDDCICDRGLIAAHHAIQQGSERLVAVGVMGVHSETKTGNLREIKEAQARADFERLAAGDVRRSDLMLCGNSSIRRAAALECPFDPTYKRMHDVEAGLRLWAKGYRPVYAIDAVAYEIFDKPVNAVLSDSRFHGRYEVFLSERRPEYKPQAPMIRINEGNPLKRWMRRQMAVNPGLSEVLLSLVSRASEPLRRFAPFRSIATRTLRARLGLHHVLGGIEEAGSWKELDNRFGKRVPVIMYHNVGRPKKGEHPGLSTPPDEFENQMQLLARMGYRTILPEQWLQWREEGGKLPERPIMLIFDDGYQEAADIAFPILERYGFKATCMIVTDCIATTNRWDEQAGRPSFPLMCEAQIQDWAAKGFEFGGHTATHLNLPDASADTVEREVKESKDTLAALLGKAPSSFAYPFGGFNDTATTAVARHFRLAFTVWPGRLHLQTNLMQAPRIAFLPGESRLGMWCRLRLGRNPFEVIRNRWRDLLGRERHDIYAGSPTDQAQTPN